ncbi:MAG: hypothetical protein Q8R15_01965 [Candidatus Micrarchaeota archaeon]|nr:hypothetical protein [Candidatus Micrarchaeota archaeon]
MEVKIVSKKQNPLFQRSEVIASITGFNATPSRKEVALLLCTELKCQADALVLREIHQPFGSKTATINAFVYNSAETAKKTERGYLFQRGNPKAAAVPA